MHDLQIHAVLVTVMSRLGSDKQNLNVFSQEPVLGIKKSLLIWNQVSVPISPHDEVFRVQP